MVCDVVVSNTKISAYWWNLAFPYSGLEGKISHALKRGQQVLPNCLGLSTKPHGVISFDCILNKLKSPLHSTCLSLIYMSTRVVKLHIKFLKTHAVVMSLHKTHGDVPPLNLFSTENL